MVLVDTSVWVLHLREGNSGLGDILNEGNVACHPFIVGELACGGLRNRATILTLLESLPMTSVVTHEDVLTFIEYHRLMGKGMGYIDVHLLASAIESDLPLWTLDKKLERIAESLHVKYQHGNV